MIDQTCTELTLRFTARDLDSVQIFSVLMIMVVYADGKLGIRVPRSG